MFCGKCGVQIEDGNVICPNCGAPVKAPTFHAVPPNSQKSFNLKNPKFLAIAGVAVVVVIVLLFTVFSGGNQSYAEAIDIFVEGVCECNGSKVLSAFPDQFLDFLVKGSGRNKGEWADMITEELEYSIDNIRSFSYQIVDTESLDQDELTELRSEYKESFNTKIKDAKIVYISLTIMSNGDYDTDTFEIYVIKVGDSWYVDPNALEAFI